MPANCADGFFVWLKAEVDESRQITSLDYGFGTNLPAPQAPPDQGDDDDYTDQPPPPFAYQLLFVLTSTATAVDLPAYAQIQKQALNLLPRASALTGTGASYVMEWTPNEANLPSDSGY